MKKGEYNLMLDIFKDCIPVIIGALIVMVPTMFEKYIERKYEKVENAHKDKQEMYVELISLFGKVLTKHDNADIEFLRERINLISITGSIDVVRALNEYIDTWGTRMGDEQNKKYGELLKVIRVDLEVDKKVNKDFPDIGLKDVNLKK